MPKTQTETTRKPKRHHRWELWTCGLRGHFTFKPTGPGTEKLSVQLSARTASGEEMWRCLRDGAFVIGPPRFSGPPTEAPLILRGPALRALALIRVLAVERFGRGLLMLSGALGLLWFNNAQAGLNYVFNQDLPIIQDAADQLGINLASNTIIGFIQFALGLDQRTLFWAAVGLGAYGLAQMVEGYGLWRQRRWGEYLAVVATSIFVPWELYELWHHASIFKAILFVANVTAVIYLLYSKRLFGLRGGKAAHEAELESASLLEVQRAAE